MTGDQVAGLVWGLGSLILVGGALAARRLPAVKLGLAALAWLAIFAVAISLAIIWGMLRHRADPSTLPKTPSGPSRTI